MKLNWMFLTAVAESDSFSAGLAEKHLATLVIVQLFLALLSRLPFLSSPSPLLFYVFSVLGATSLSTGTPKPSTVCCPVETCNLPPSLSQTHDT